MLLRASVSKVAKAVIVKQIRWLDDSHYTFASRQLSQCQPVSNMDSYKVNWIPSKASKGPGRTTDQELCVLTYNVLAPKYTATGFHGYCPDEALDWSYRYPLILNTIQSINPDILALQEVEVSIFHNQFSLDLQNYKGHFYGRAVKPTDPVPGPSEGPCLFIKKDKLDVVRFTAVRLADVVEEGKEGEIWELVRQKEDGAVLGLVRSKSSGSLLLAVCTHLFWNPDFPDVKAVQAELLCRHIAETLSREGSAAPVILAGDFNSLWRKYTTDAWDTVPVGGYISSGAYELLSTGSLPDTAPDHPRQRRAAYDVQALTTAGLRWESAMLAANGKEPPLTNKTSTFAGCLDYIWMQQGKWEVLATLGLPYPEDAGPQPECVDLPPCPNPQQPSDHLPIACKLQLLEPSP
eukprot:jgi/Botrbrau1/7094/Bobra.0165s0116.1